MVKKVWNFPHCGLNPTPTPLLHSKMWDKNTELRLHIFLESEKLTKTSQSKEREREKKRERESSVNIPIIELQSTLSTSELLSCSVLCQYQICWVAECSVNLPIDKLQSTLPTYWKWRYRVLTFLIIYLLCQHTKISVTECSVKCVVFELQSTLWAE